MKNKRFTAKILIDIGMTICLLLLMPYSLLSETAHEWIGMAMLVLFIAHHMLNRKWLLSIGKGKYNAFRVIQTVLVIIMFILMMGSMISGILLSNYIFKWIKISGTYVTARQIHMFCAYWGLVVMSLHLGFHWNIAVAMAGRLWEHLSVIRTWVARSVATTIAGYGLYAFYRRQIGDYLLMRMHFVFYDYEEGVFPFLIDYLAVMILIAFIGYYILENVPGLLSHDKGRTFCTILSTLSELGYHVEWKVLNSKDFGVPQARKRVYIVGYLDFRCAGKVLPEPETNGAALVQIRAGSQGKRVYSPKGLSCTLTSQAGGMGGKTGLYDVGVPIKENTKLGYKLAREGDSIDLGYANLNSRRGRVGHQIAHTLTTGIQQGTLHFVDLSPPPLVTEECRSLNTRQCGIHKYKGECSGVLSEEGARAVLTPAKENVRQNGRRMKEPEEPMFGVKDLSRGISR